MAQRKPAIRVIDGLLFERRLPSEKDRESPSWKALVEGGYFTESESESESEIDFGPRCGAALGISVERQSVSWALVTDPTGRRIASDKAPVPVAPIGDKDGPEPERLRPEEFKRRLAAVLATAREQAPTTSLAGVGVAWPSAITLAGEPGFDSHHRDFAGRDLRADIRSAVEQAGFSCAPDASASLPVQFINDADADLLFEARWGCAVGVRNLLGVKLCGGIGGAVLHEGHLMRGAHGRAGEVNHTPVPVDWKRSGLDGDYDNVLPLEDLRPCDCRNASCIRRFASGLAIIDTLTTYDDPDYNVRGAEIENAVRGPDAQRIAAVFARAGELLGQALIGAVRLLDPERVVISAFPRHDNLSTTVGSALTRSDKVGIKAQDVLLATPGSHVTPAGAARVVIEEQIIPMLEQAEGVCATKSVVPTHALPSALRLYIQPHDEVSTYVRRY